MKYSPRLILYLSLKNYLTKEQLQKFDKEIGSKNPSGVKFLHTFYKHFDIERYKNEPFIWQDIWLYNYLVYDVKNKRLNRSRLVAKYEREIILPQENALDQALEILRTNVKADIQKSIDEYNLLVDENLLNIPDEPINKSSEDPGIIKIDRKEDKEKVKEFPPIDLSSEKQQRLLSAMGIRFKAKKIDEVKEIDTLKNVIEVINTNTTIQKQFVMEKKPYFENYDNINLPEILKKEYEKIAALGLICLIFLWIFKVFYCSSWGEKTIGSFFEADEYKAKYYVDVFPDKNKSKNYRLPADVSIETSENKLIYLEKAYWPNGGYSEFYDCRLFINKLCSCKDQHDRNFYIELIDKKVRNN